MSKIPTGQVRLRALAGARFSRTRPADSPPELHARQIEPKMQYAELQQPDAVQKKSHDRYTKLSEFSPVGYLTLSRMGVIENVNFNAARLLGVDCKDMLHCHFEHFVAPDYLDRWHRYFMSLIEHSEPKNIELVLMRTPAAVFHAQLELVGMATHKRDTVMRITLTDITERKQAEQESIRLLQRNQMLMNTSLDGIHVMDIQGNLLEANDAFCHMLGYTQDEISHLNVADWDAQFTAHELRLAFKESIGKSAVVETLHRRKDGLLINVEISVSGNRIDGRDYIFASSRDITERKRIASSLEETTKLLRELVAKHESSLEEERKLIAREVHDELGQILTTLRMDIAVMRIRFGKDNPELMALVHSMTELVDRAINGVRNVAENLRPVALDIGIVSAIEWLCSDFSIHTGVSCVLHSTDKFIDLDRARTVVLFRIVQESLTNVTRHASARNVKIIMSLNCDDLCLEVKDDGKGFNMNSPTKQKSYGLLGMTERALNLGGVVNIVSAKSKGTTVSVRIPVNSRVDTQ